MVRLDSPKILIRGDIFRDRKRDFPVTKDMKILENVLVEVTTMKGKVSPRLKSTAVYPMSQGGFSPKKCVIMTMSEAFAVAPSDARNPHRISCGFTSVIFLDPRKPTDPPPYILNYNSLVGVFNSSFFCFASYLLLREIN